MFETLAADVAHAEEVGFETIIGRGRRAADGLPDELVYAGLSLGVPPAQMLAQTRPGARGAVLCSARVPAVEFGTWPSGVPLQIHMTESDPVVADEGDLDVARTLAAEIEGAELFLYSGDRHLFMDESHADYDDQAAARLNERMLAMLDLEVRAS